MEKMTFYDVTDTPVDFQTNKGRVTIHNGWAAGDSWLLMEFHDLPELSGKQLWLNNDEREATYVADCNDDGFVFNYPMADANNASLTYVEGGEYLPNLDLTVRIV